MFGISRNTTRDMRPGHVVVLDVMPPMESKIVTLLSESLQRVVLLSNEIRGSVRIPALGLMTVSTYAELILPLQNIDKANFHCFRTALLTLKSIIKDEAERHDWSNISYNHAFLECFQSVIDQWKKFAHSLTSNEALSRRCQLQITIFSCMELNTLVKKIEDSLQYIDLTNVKKIVVISIINPLKSTCENEDVQLNENHTRINGNSYIGVVEGLQIINNEFQFDNIFRSWFHTTDIDKEHVHLVLSNLNETSTIKCDMFEKVLNPSFLSCAKRFVLNSYPFLSVQATTSFTKSSGLQWVSPLQLKTRALVNVSGLCDSLVFGHPILLQPTKCWKIDWEQLELNQQRFFALRCLLYKRDIALIVEQFIPSPPGLIAGQGTQGIHGHFVILPSPTDFLLMKSIAVNELLLPDAPSYSESKFVSQEVRNEISSLIDALPAEDIYNPLHFSSSLFSVLLESQDKIKPFKSSNLFGDRNKNRTENSNPLNRSLPNSRPFPSLL